MKLPKTFLSLVIASSVACGQDSGNGTEVRDPLGPGDVAIINGERLPESVYRLFTLGALQTNADNLTPEGRAEVIDRLVGIKLLAQEAERNGLDQERRIAAELELQRLQLLARHMADRYAEENPPTEAELRDVYQENLPRLRATRYKTRHILVDSEEEAEDLIEELDDGEDFAELAMEHSTDVSASEGGDLGWLQVDGVVEPFGAALLEATPGTYTPTPIETEFGWHILLVEEIEENAAPGLNAVRQDLTVAVESLKLEEYMNELRSGGEVEIVE